MQTFTFAIPEGGSYTTALTTTPTGEVAITITVNEGSKFEEVLRRTIACGMMNADGHWAATTTKKQIAIWTKLTSTHIGSPTIWSWAEKRWGLKHLAMVHDKALNYRNYVEIERQIIRDCFE